MSKQEAEEKCGNSRFIQPETIAGSRHDPIRPGRKQRRPGICPGLTVQETPLRIIRAVFLFWLAA
jgi:hypothetical protein